MNWGHRPAKWTLVAGGRLEAPLAKAKLLDMDNCISVNLQQDYFKSSLDQVMMGTLTIGIATQQSRFVIWHFNCGSMRWLSTDDNVMLKEMTEVK